MAQYDQVARRGPGRLWWAPVLALALLFSRGRSPAAADDSDTRAASRAAAVRWAMLHNGKVVQPCRTPACLYTETDPGVAPCFTPDPAPDREDENMKIVVDRHPMWFFYCARFVANAYGRPNAGFSAEGLWNEVKGVAETDFSAVPAGALVFWRWADANHMERGHVGICVGSNRVSHSGLSRTTGVVRQELSEVTAALDQAMQDGASSLRGWVDPTLAPLNWGTANESEVEGRRIAELEAEVTRLRAEVASLTQRLAAAERRAAPERDPVRSIDTSSWTHAELIAHLRAQGLPVTTARAKDTTPDRSFGGPGLYLMLAPGRIYCQLRATVENAREKSALDPEHTASWGRFYFEGDAAVMAQVLRALRLDSPSRASPEKPQDAPQGSSGQRLTFGPDQIRLKLAPTNLVVVMRSAVIIGEKLVVRFAIRNESDTEVWRVQIGGNGRILRERSFVTDELGNVANTGVSEAFRVEPGTTSEQMREFAAPIARATSIRLHLSLYVYRGDTWEGADQGVDFQLSR